MLEILNFFDNVFIVYNKDRLYWFVLLLVGLLQLDLFCFLRLKFNALVLVLLIPL